MTTLSRRLAALLAALPILLALAACDSAVEPVPDGVVAGLDVTRLFAPATAQETAAVRRDWAARQPAATSVEVGAPALLPDGARLYVVSHALTGPGATGRHAGFVRVPAGASGLPVLVVHHGGDGGVSATAPDPNVGVTAMAQAFPALFAETVQVFPSYRAEPLRTDGLAGLGPTVTSGGAPSPWDYDVDDAMALLSAVLARDEFAAAIDAERVGTLGFSRGANTALLQNARDGRVGATVAYYGPSDFFNAAAQQLAVALVSGDANAARLPGGAFLRDNVLAPLRTADGAYDPAADYDRARLEVVRRSASAFTADLNNVQIHHHLRDGVVPVPFSLAFDAAARERPVGGGYAFATYGEPAATLADLSPQVHTPRAMPESLGATEAWLAQYVTGARAPNRAPRAVPAASPAAF